METRDIIDKHVRNFKKLKLYHVRTSCLKYLLHLSGIGIYFLGHAVARSAEMVRPHAHPQQNSALPLYSNQQVQTQYEDLNGSHPLSERAKIYFTGDLTVLVCAILINLLLF